MTHETDHQNTKEGALDKNPSVPLIYFEAKQYLTETLNNLLRVCHSGKVSDISLIPNDPPWVRQEGKWHRLNDVPIRRGEIERFVADMTKSPSTPAKAMSGEDQDFAYEVPVGRGEFIRFRVNATGCKIDQDVGISVVMRAIMPTPPSIHSMNVEPEIIQAITPLYGLVLITGPVGSGKTTLIASAMREILVTQPKNVLTYEDPVEFDLRNIEGRIGLITQTEISKGLRDFSRAPRNSLRRAGDVVLFGESRDLDTLRNLSIVAETGVAVYTTVHTNSVAETISRIVREFSVDERDGLAAALVTSMRLIVHQRLFRNRQGRRIALREYLIFDEDIRQTLVKISYENLAQAIDILVDDRGQSLAAAAKKSYLKGDLSQADYDEIIAIKMQEKKSIY